MNNLPAKYHFSWTEKEEHFAHWKEIVAHESRFSSSLLMPPPNITGNLHLGHSLELVLQDFLIRSSYLEKKPVYSIVGMDHGGISTQKKIESFNLPFLKSIVDKKNYAQRIWYPKIRQKFFQQWGGLGLFIDHQNIHFTLDKSSQKQVKQAFIQLYRAGLIYREKKLINWDPQLKSAISDIEVEYRAGENKLYYLKYPLFKGNGYLLVATSRPETIFADAALFVNPKDARYQKHIGEQIKHPINNKIIPILADEKVVVNFGTGVLKCTPGHDFSDYELGKKHKLPIISCFDERGFLNNLAGQWQGQEPQNIRLALVKELEEKGICSKIENYQTNLIISQKTGSLIEPLLSTQWFCNLPALIRKIEQTNPNFLDEVNFHPPRFKKVIQEWKEKTHEWCISRQLWWGHLIPAWYHKQTEEIYVGEQAPNEQEWQQETDVLDTWFSSGLWQIITLQEKEKNFPSPNPEFFPITTLITGYDILFFWVLKMLLLGYYFTKKNSFKNIYLHGLICDNQGRKMSKSFDNGIEPETIIKKYGSDSLRLFFLENNIWGSDLIYEESKIKGCFNFLQKLWSIGNFLLLKIEKRDLKVIDFFDLENELSNEKIEDLKIINNWLLNEVQKIKKNYFKHSKKLETSYLIKKLIDFTWQKVSNDYLELIKIDPWSQSTKKAFLYTYQQILLLLHPFIPFITEYLYQKVSGKKLLDYSL